MKMTKIFSKALFTIGLALISMASLQAQSTEILASGEAQLENGKCHIALPAHVTQQLATNAAGEYTNRLPQVSIQLLGNSPGVYVTNRTQEGFDVVELKDGRSNVRFSWLVMPGNEQTGGLKEEEDR